MAQIPLNNLNLVVAEAAGLQIMTNSLKQTEIRIDDEKPGDIALAFSDLKERLRAFIKRRLPDESLTDDLLQDVFVKALSAQQSGRVIDNLTGWLFTSARTTVIDFYRSNGIVYEEVNENFSEIDDSEQLSLHKEFATCIESFIDNLPEIYRETLRATEIERRSLVDFAQTQQVSLSAIKSRAARGRAMLKKQLLACCHIEVSDGYVSDYYKKPS